MPNSKKSMKITENYVRKIIQEVAPLVEDLSRLKCNLKEHDIVFDFLTQDALMQYSPDEKIFMLRKNFKEGNEDYFKISIGHELMHNAQFSSFPELIQKEKEIGLYKVELPLNGEITNPLDKLLEGDATLIESELNKKYFRKAECMCSEGYLMPIKSMPLSEWHSWEKILREKFKADRKEINKLYNSSIGELSEIFNAA